MARFNIVRHPLAQDALVRLRDGSTSPCEFRLAMRRLTQLVASEAMRGLTTRTVRVRTPLGYAGGRTLRDPVIFVPVLRAGLGMLEVLLEMVPGAHVGFIGLKREESTLKASLYHKSLPQDLSRHQVFLLDPMLATGGSTVSAVDLLRERGARKVRLLNLVAAPRGVRTAHAAHPGLEIFSAALDKSLNEKGFILPGLGDAGDRLFGV